MTDRTSRHPQFPATVHCWSDALENQTFNSLSKALDYCRKNMAELPAIEVFVHCGVPDQIISGDELEALLKRKRRSLA
ncbi:hypothetical protein KX729_32560 [Rhizobium sp. XQZ8]|uniref:hypothetical protein n=1 Tax=Rhizobium populisoli TaxID=2859785 RepID=UPI001CA523C5|nr:hypothetical protein [Rhizobium populisoli]MBW6426098.1 hypothetical protein [Rhizobium populisoli]